MKKMLLFIFPLLVVISFDLILPADFFTFRCWEALSVYSRKNFNFSPFYPFQYLKKIEVGDLGHHTTLARPHEVEWFTDQYGYRNRPWSGHVDIALVGDSFIVGSGVSQADTLAEVLSRKTGLRVVSIAPCNLGDYLGIKEFVETPPKYVVVEKVEAQLGNISTVKFENYTITPYSKNLGLYFYIFQDRFEKNCIYHAFTSQSERLYRMGLKFFSKPSIKIEDYDDVILTCNYRYSAIRDINKPDILFYSGLKANSSVTKEVCSRVTEIVDSYKKIIEGRGSRFVFMPIPNKESILLGPEGRNYFLEDLNLALEDKGIEHLDLQGIFKTDINKENLYLKDDGHWSEYGIRVTADQLSGYFTESTF